MINQMTSSGGQGGSFFAGKNGIRMSDGYRHQTPRLAPQKGPPRSIFASKNSVEAIHRDQRQIIDAFIRRSNGSLMNQWVAPSSKMRTIDGPQQHRGQSNMLNSGSGGLGGLPALQSKNGTRDEDEDMYEFPKNLSPKGARLTLKVEISYTDHSHLIGCRGLTIRKVMKDTSCHVHFPDSNKGSKEFKSNQVTIAGSTLADIERARARIRELSPLVFHIRLPMICDPSSINPETYQVFIENIQTAYRVQVTIQSPNKYQQTTTLTVKGCEIDAPSVIEAATRIMEFFCSYCGSEKVNTVLVETTLDITAGQQHFVRSFNDSNLARIIRNTGALIIFPDLADTSLPHLKRSRVIIKGEITSVYQARQQLIGSLPVKLICEVPDELNLIPEEIYRINTELNVTVKIYTNNRSTVYLDSNGQMNNSGVNWMSPYAQNLQSLNESTSPGGQFPNTPGPNAAAIRAVHLITSERNLSNIYEARRRIMGGDQDSPMTATALIPQRKVADWESLTSDEGIGSMDNMSQKSQQSNNNFSFTPKSEESGDKCSETLDNSFLDELLRFEDLKVSLSSTPEFKKSAPTNLTELFAISGLADYTDLFLQQGINLSMFSILTEKELVYLGVQSSAAREKIVELIAQTANLRPYVKWL